MPPRSPFHLLLRRDKRGWWGHGAVPGRSRASVALAPVLGLAHALRRRVERCPVHRLLLVFFVVVRELAVVDGVVRAGVPVRAQHELEVVVRLHRSLGLLGGVRFARSLGLERVPSLAEIVGDELAHSLVEDTAAVLAKHRARDVLGPVLRELDRRAHRGNGSTGDEALVRALRRHVIRLRQRARAFLKQRLAAVEEEHELLVVVTSIAKGAKQIDGGV